MRADAVRRALRTELEAARARGAEPVRVVDVGGGTGGWAVPLAEFGAAVTVIDPSPDALANLRRRAVDADVAELITAVQGDTEALADCVPSGGADLVLGHGILEVVDDVGAALAALRAVTAPGGAISLLVANKYATLLRMVLAGRVIEAHRLLDDPDGAPAGDILARRFDVDSLRTALEEAGLEVSSLHGYGVLADLVPGATAEDPGVAEALAQLELAAAGTSPLREMAAQLHALVRPR
ncbi:class I SAM-dependent methyltransferase [Sciscionella sediminilitoris]|uniref:class I SAM-dependent methyltransferase n=1 Tax=Sciscionella sediminilitoris TaxID=1445613 RepID=UPI0004DF78D9|nr:methyltransferase domain-containing protein [Sciscionella sp. SE31]